MYFTDIIVDWYKYTQLYMNEAQHSLMHPFSGCGMLILNNTTSDTSFVMNDIKFDISSYNSMTQSTDPHLGVEK